MRSKSKNEQDLLLFLSKKQDYITSQDILEVLNVSQKTVYCLINKINNQYEGGPLIISERGRGYKLDYEKFIHFQRGDKKDKEIQFSPSERRRRIMEELLLCSPKAINVYQLFSRYYVGDSVSFNDEQIMSEELDKYNLVLERKNRTLAIIGEEVNIRKAIKDMNDVFNAIDIDDLEFSNFSS